MQRRGLDVYCCAGGATRGYQLAGFHMTGVDISPQPRYCGEEFIQADALDVLADRQFLSQFAFIHASPPCHDHIRTKPGRALDGTGFLLPATRQLLGMQPQLWVLENVPGAQMRADYTLCGCMFGLAVRRERWFETSWRGFDLRPPCQHDQPALTLYGRDVTWSHMRNQAARYVGVEAGRAAMGIDWMTLSELVEAIPPAYTEYIGGRLLDALGVAA